jgi:hypothetical protein
MPAAHFVLGATQDEADERAIHIRLQQAGPRTALALLEEVWRRDLSSYDPDGPVLDVPRTTRGAETAGAEAL